jgi:hypothetical protein
MVRPLLIITSWLFITTLSPIVTLSTSIAQEAQNNTTGIAARNNFSFVVSVRGLTEYNEDKLAVVITSGDLIESKIVDRSEAVLPPGESTGPRTVDTQISFPANSGLKAGDEFQACVLSLGAQYQSVECQYGVINSPETGPQKLIIPL